MARTPGEAPAEAPGSGALPRQVLDKAAIDISDANGPPVYIVIDQADVSEDAQAVVAQNRLRSRSPSGAPR